MSGDQGKQGQYKWPCACSMRSKEGNKWQGVYFWEGKTCDFRRLTPKSPEDLHNFFGAGDFETLKKIGHETGATEGDIKLPFREQVHIAFGTFEVDDFPFAKVGYGLVPTRVPLLERSKLMLKLYGILLSDWSAKNRLYSFGSVMRKTPLYHDTVNIWQEKNHRDMSFLSNPPGSGFELC